MNVALHPTRDTLHVISLCTGGGGLDLGLGLAIPGARAICMVEREAFAVAHLVSAMEEGLMAPCPVWSDARTFDGRPWRGLVDGLIGGIPCQPHSLAGRKRGSLDERDLWSPTRRIIAQARPWFVLIENVAGMLSPGADEIAGAERVWRDLRRLGFTVEGGLFTAAEVGAPHERERLFILGVADRDGERRDGQRVCLRQGEPEQHHTETAGGGEGSSGVGLADAYHAGLEGHGRPVERAGERASGPRGGELEHAALDGRREGRTEPAIRSGGSPAAGADCARVSEPCLFPPGPRDLDAWREVLARTPHLEPAVRRLADGLAATRIDWLRLLGNGVVPLQAAYAIRTLAARMADGGSAGAARLVRLTEPTHD